MQIIPYNSAAIQPAQITLVQATYNGNDAGGPAATGLPADTWTVLGQPMVLASTFPSREGYRFVAWNTAANGLGTSYQPGATIPNVLNDITLYAQWEGTGPVVNTIEYCIQYAGSHAGGGRKRSHLHPNPHPGGLCLCRLEYLAGRHRDHLPARPVSHRTGRRLGALRHVDGHRRRWRRRLLSGQLLSKQLLPEQLQPKRLLLHRRLPEQR